jgi:hypothetical protein
MIKNVMKKIGGTLIQNKNLLATYFSRYLENKICIKLGVSVVRSCMQFQSYIDYKDRLVCTRCLQIRVERSTSPAVEGLRTC